MRALIETHPGWEVCGETGDGRTAVEMAGSLMPDVVVMDIGMPKLNGFEATRQILERHRGVEVLVLSMHESEQTIREVIEAGARGYVLKSDAGRDLVTAIEALLGKQPFFSARIATKLREHGMAPHSVRRRSLRPSGELTRREREIVQLLAEGKTNKAAAKVLGISVKTVETHRARVMRKLKMESIADLVRYAVRNGYVLP
jgi:DNA-binding NarL/FixJ family response regulator